MFGKMTSLTGGGGFQGGAATSGNGDQNSGGNSRTYNFGPPAFQAAGNNIQNVALAGLGVLGLWLLLRRR